MENPDLKGVFVFPVVNPQGYQMVGTVERIDLINFMSQYSDDEKQYLANRSVHIKYEPLVVTVLEDTPIQQLHMFFITNRLRYTFVTRQGVPVGLITREGLASALRRQRHLI